MTQDAQGALRRIMENYAHITRFCLVCNYVTRSAGGFSFRCLRLGSNVACLQNHRAVDVPLLQIPLQTSGQLLNEKPSAAHCSARKPSCVGRGIFFHFRSAHSPDAAGFRLSRLSSPAPKETSVAPSPSCKPLPASLIRHPSRREIFRRLRVLCRTRLSRTSRTHSRSTCVALEMTMGWMSTLDRRPRKVSRLYARKSQS